MRRVERALLDSYFRGESKEYMASRPGRMDLADHLMGRLEEDRRFLLPWLDSEGRSLVDARVLEVGCGTGASTVALAEQGAHVTAIDIDEGAISVARERCTAFHVDAQLVVANVSDVKNLVLGGSYDLIVFIASLEHMMLSERLDSIRDTWSMVKDGGLWVVAQTPNRLWPVDQHTSLLPFFSWLPDDLALQYASASPRESFSRQFRNPHHHDLTALLRRGRGVSYHEFDVALGEVWRPSASSCLAHWHRRQKHLKHLQWRLSPDFRVTRLLQSLAPPNIHAGFFEPLLNLVLAKNRAQEASTSRQ